MHFVYLAIVFIPRLALFGMTLTEYGTHYKSIGRLDESERAFSRALAIAKQVLGPSHEQVCSNGLCISLMKRFDLRDFTFLSIP